MSRTLEICVFVEPQQGATYDELRVFAQTAERLGFDGFFRSDHYLAFYDADGLPGPTDAWTTLAGLARDTQTLRLGTLVSSVTFRNPGVLAIQVAQVDQMSGGRAELGLGTGWFAREHEAYGIPFPEKRFGLLEEGLAITTGLWSTPVGETFNHSGEHFTLVDAPGLVRPVQKRMPVIVGGGGPKRTPALAAKYATEFNIGFVDEAAIAEKFAGVRAAAAAIDRDPADLKYSVALPTAVGITTADYDRRARASHSEPDEFAEINIAGSPSEAIDKIGRLAGLGAQRVYLQLHDIRDLEHLELLGAEVLPQVR